MLAVTTSAPATEVSVCTDLGAFSIELFDEQAPAHAANFLRYVEHGFYSGTVFHRVVGGGIVQGGGYDRELHRRATFEPVQNESRNGMSNERGTVAAARSDDPHSATSQFFINLADNPALDGTHDDFGYTVFGRVVSGMEIVDRIGALPTGSAGPLAAEVPEPLVALSSMAVIDRAALAALPEASRAEEIQREISDAAALNDPGRTLEWVRHYRAICAPPDSYVLLIEANAALAKHDVRRAQAALDDYFAITDAAHPTYRSAETLSRNLVPAMPPVVETLFAHCDLPEKPAIPNGNLGSLEDMVEGQAAVRDYMGASEMYLDCLSEVIDRRDLSDAEHASAVRRHNEAVALMEELAESFNRQVRIFKAREP